MRLGPNIGISHEPTQMEMAGWGPPKPSPDGGFQWGHPHFRVLIHWKRWDFPSKSSKKSWGYLHGTPPWNPLRVSWGKIPSQRKMSIYRWDFPSNLSARPQPFLPAGPATERRTRGVRNDVTLHELPEPNAGRELGELCLSQQPTQIYATCAMDNSPLKWMVYDDLPQIWGCHVSFFGCKSRKVQSQTGKCHLLCPPVTKEKTMEIGLFESVNLSKYGPLIP